MATESVFMRGGNLLRVCEMTDSQGSSFRMEPYIIYTSGKGRRMLYYYRLAEPPGFASIEARFVASVKMLEERFTPRPEYVPFDKLAFPTVHFSIATHDGRLRWVDKATEADKAKLPLRPNLED